MKFIELNNAQSYRDRAFETTGTSLMIVLYDFPYFMVCTRREAAQLVKQGYELAE